MLFVGYRVTEEILRSVPNVQSFKLVLRAIKLWAKREFSHTVATTDSVSFAKNKIGVKKKKKSQKQL